MSCAKALVDELNKMAVELERLKAEVLREVPTLAKATALIEKWRGNRRSYHLYDAVDAEARHRYLSSQSVNGRRLMTGPCSGGCGKVLSQWVTPESSICCQDCADSESRDEAGWTPQNSRD